MNTKHNPASIAPPTGKYTHGIAVSAGARWLHISGQIGSALDGTVPPDFHGQVENCWTNIKAILADGHMGIEDIVKVTVYVTKAENIGSYRDSRDQIMGEARPASTLVVVNSLVRPEWLCEVEVIAAKSGH